jgi:sugar lactone lactonase YvrE
MSFQIQCIFSGENHLGEGPIWDEEFQALYWIDVTGIGV